eukprot:1157490-Pelagomonas_calceolata.AAC.6
MPEEVGEQFGKEQAWTQGCKASVCASCGTNSDVKLARGAVHVLLAAVLGVRQKNQSRRLTRLALNAQLSNVLRHNHAIIQHLVLIHAQLIPCVHQSGSVDAYRKRSRLDGGRSSYNSAIGAQMQQQQQQQQQQQLLEEQDKPSAFQVLLCWTVRQCTAFQDKLEVQGSPGKQRDQGTPPASPVSAQWFIAGAAEQGPGLPGALLLNCPLQTPSHSCPPVVLWLWLAHWQAC